MDIEDKLKKERGGIYGPHEENAEDFASIMKIFARIGKCEYKDTWYIYNIVQKLIRIANSPYYKDNHDDLRTYDRLWWEKIEKAGQELGTRL